MRRVRPLISTLLLLAGAALQWPATAAEPPSVPNTIEQRVLACAPCHGANGEGLRKNEYYPRLAGKPAGYLYNQLINFRDKRREFSLMNYIVAYLSDAYLLEIANHYANLAPPFPPPQAAGKPADMALGAKLVNEGDAARKLPSCASCHGQALTGLQPAIPGLLGLYPPYISSQLGGWKGDKRHAMAPDCMHQVATLLTPEDIGAVTAWLVAQPVPADMRPAAAGSLKLPLECGGLTKK